MRLAIIGTGYVGLTAAVGFSDVGNQVVGVDNDEEKLTLLSRGRSPVQEPGLEERLGRNIAAGRLRFTSDIDAAMRTSEIVFLAVGTPSLPDGNPDLRQVMEVVEAFSRNLDRHRTLVLKSTVPVGTNGRIRRLLSARHGPDSFDVVSNPEFLREGKAVHDFLHPDRVVIGTAGGEAGERIRSLYRPLHPPSTPFVLCDPATAELIKYASNAFLAVKISFINEIANLCDPTGADVLQVARAVGLDARIGPEFLRPGPGFGGSCFPKDARALLALSDSCGVDLSIVRSSLEANQRQIHGIAARLRGLAGGLRGRTVAVLGLSFKSETDDVRESPAIEIIRDLLAEGAEVRAHDPRAVGNMKRLFPALRYFPDAQEAVRGSDAVLLATEWDEYRNLDLEAVKAAMRGAVILDARNILDPDRARSLGFTYAGIGRR